MLTSQKEKAYSLLKQYKKDAYIFGPGVFPQVATHTANIGAKALVISNNSGWLEPYTQQLLAILKSNNIILAGNSITPGAKPNTPLADVYRIGTYILHLQPDSLIALGSGSTIDAVKAANVLGCLGGYSPDIETYFGTGKVTDALSKSGFKLLPMLAIETAASSGAHLTKYSNVTDLTSQQKKLIVDEAIVPTYALFDYDLTASTPRDLLLDGAFDGIAHCLEVFYGANETNYQLLRDIALTGTELIIKGLLDYKSTEINNSSIREMIGLGTDLGGYAIMVGGTSGPHLTSFSLVDLTSHGRACAVMLPYYTMFFAPAIKEQLQDILPLLQKYDLIDTKGQNGADMGPIEAAHYVAKGLLNLKRLVGFPVKLNDLTSFDPSYIDKITTAAKNPQLEMKLKNMPVPLSSAQVEEYMRPILQAAADGDLALIKHLN